MSWFKEKPLAKLYGNCIACSACYLCASVEELLCCPKCQSADGKPSLRAQQFGLDTPCVVCNTYSSRLIEIMYGPYAGWAYLYCGECGYEGDPQPTKTKALIEWNRSYREQKGKKRKRRQIKVRSYGDPGCGIARQATK